jgi:hypothetical protein
MAINATVRAQQKATPVIGFLRARLEQRPTSSMTVRRRSRVKGG